MKGSGSCVKRKIMQADLMIMSIITLVVLFFVNSVTWVTYEWENVDFSTIMFQLHTPLQGTNPDLVSAYVNSCIPKTIIGTIVIAGSYFLLKEAGKKRKVWAWILRIYFWGLFIGGFSLSYINIKDIGVFKYLHDIGTRSTIFEEYYIEPEDAVLKFPKNKRNLILIYMESMETTYASADVGGGKTINYIPRLTSLAMSNINFSNGSQLGGGKVVRGCEFTTGAIVGTSSGVPFKSMVERNSMDNYGQFLPGLITLGDILEKEGYSNYFLCGSEAEFGGRKLFYEKHGNYQIQDYHYAIEQGYIPEDYYKFWGYEDFELFAIAKAELEKLGNSGELFNYTMLTIDTHHPGNFICTLCGSEYDEPYANVISCSDRQIAEFISWMEEQEWYEDTTVVLIGDHTSMVADFWDDIGDYSRRTYNCFLNMPTGINTEHTKNREFDTLDYFPTILAALNVKIEGDRLGLGTNLFSEKLTLSEEMGEEYEQEISKYSDYYVNRFEKGDTK